MLHLQLVVTNFLPHNQEDDKQGNHRQGDNQIEFQVAIAVQAFQFALLRLQLVFRLDSLDVLVGVFSIGLHHVRGKLLVVFHRLLVVAFAVGNGIKRLIDRHFQSGTLAAECLVQIGLRLFVFACVIIEDAQGHVGNVGVVVAEADFQGLVDALDAFGEVACFHVVVAAHLEIEVSEHGLVVDEGGDAEGRVVVLLGLGVLLLRPHRPTAVAVGVHHAR